MPKAYGGSGKWERGLAGELFCQPKCLAAYNIAGITAEHDPPQQEEFTLEALDAGLPRNIETEGKAVLAHLNAKLGTRYKTVTPNLRARLGEYSVADCKRVIDIKVAEWTGTEWAKYLTPTTLFRPSKFEAYINQPVAKQGPAFVPSDDQWEV